VVFFFFSSRRRHTRSTRDWSSDVCSSDLDLGQAIRPGFDAEFVALRIGHDDVAPVLGEHARAEPGEPGHLVRHGARRAQVEMDRSEERRVGKEWRERGTRDQYKRETRKSK